MKMITAIFRPERLKDVKNNLVQNKVVKMTVANCKGAGDEEGYTEVYRGGEAEIDLLNRVRLDVAVNEEYVDTAVDAIIEAARTGEVGDGKIFVQDLDACIRIRTGERGEEAIG
jgi:nitrogen regulatory protein P-II 1